MRVLKKTAGAFLKRLAETVEQVAADDPDIMIATADAWRVESDGRLAYDHSGAEAILLLRGPEHSRRQALRNLLAQLED